MAALVVLASAAALIITARLQGPEAPERVAGTRATPMPPVAAPETAPPVTAAVPADTRRALAAVPVDSPPVRRPPDTAARRVPVVRAGGAAAAQTRWTNDWANVREGRGLEDSVVMVLRPGRQVEVVDRAAGWWGVVVDGRRVGYVAMSLLDTVPPDTVSAGGGVGNAGPP